jgi:hypothetical protein
VYARRVYPLRNISPDLHVFAIVYLMKTIELVFREELKKEYNRGVIRGGIYGLLFSLGIYILFLR